ncbi:MAG TPA: glycyl-radical enzyme activating protein [Candidatus Binatia bacterium]|nr:glycyl-radical enzyme activating protein [Candidatus Binatia bacterium]
MGQPAPTEERCRETGDTCRGLVFNIMRFAVHDGPGIRTTVFLKGCPLNCWWCHNPEGRSGKPEVAYVAERCIRCGDCVRACPEGSLVLDDCVVRDPHLCRLHSRCVDACSTGAQEVVGRWMSPSDVLEEVVKDQIFFDESGGGVTISGGEPLMQTEFVEALLVALRAQRIHTALDTCGFGELNAVARISRNVDLFLFDLKLVDPKKHQQFTGVRNDRILASLRLLAEYGNAVIIRIPVIPGVNDDEDNLTAVSGLLSSLRLRNIDLLPYHRIASGKYSRLNLTYRMEDVVPPTLEHMQVIAARFGREGFHVQIGG